MIRLFISYRRNDSEHAAQRVRACMQAKFGADAVFIDRDIPPGTDWAQYLHQRLESSSDVIVLVGDAFLRELRRRGSAAEADEQDWLKTEIETALKLGKTIYPVIIGRIDMPDKNDMPVPIRDFANAQAVFAREPAFDAAMAVLGKAIAARHSWIEPPPSGTAPATGALGQVGSVALGAAMALLGVWLAGWLIHWLATGASGAEGQATLWLGVLYVLTTLLWGLGPYLVYRSVAEVRARAHLPVNNLHGTLTMLNLGLALLAGGSFLLLSTRADWALHLRWVMPVSPQPLHYALQGLVLLLIVFAAVLVAMLEPVVRKWSARRRWLGSTGLVWAAIGVALASAWFAESLVTSLPPLRAVNTVPLIGYFMLAPALSGLIVAWDLARWSLGFGAQAWHSRALFGLAVCLYVVCTLGYFAHGPVRLFVGLG